MRVSERFESYRHPEISEDVLKTLATDVSRQIRQLNKGIDCKVGYTSLCYNDGKQIAFIITEKSIYPEFEYKWEFEEYHIQILSLSEITKLSADWSEVIKKYGLEGIVENKYSKLIEYIHWIGEISLVGKTAIIDKMVAILSIMDTVSLEYEQVGKKDKVLSRAELEKLYLVLYNLCRVFNEMVQEIDIEEIRILNKELELFRVEMPLDSRDSRGKYTELIRFCKNINWNKKGIRVLISRALNALLSREC